MPGNRSDSLLYPVALAAGAIVAPKVFRMSLVMLDKVYVDFMRPLTFRIIGNVEQLDYKLLETDGRTSTPVAFDSIARAQHFAKEARANIQAKQQDLDLAKKKHLAAAVATREKEEDMKTSRKAYFAACKEHELAAEKASVLPKEAKAIGDILAGLQQTVQAAQVIIPLAKA